MTRNSGPTKSIFPDGGDAEADLKWVKIVAKLHLDLQYVGHGVVLSETLQRITAKEDPTPIEYAYLRAVIQSAWWRWW